MKLILTEEKPSVFICMLNVTTRDSERGRIRKSNESYVTCYNTLDQCKRPIEKRLENRSYM